MEYKKIFKNKKIRLKLLEMTNFIPDSIMIKFQYKIKTGRWPDLKNPVRYTEKLQWYKLNYRDPLMRICSDKYLVREYIKSKKLENILNPLYNTYIDTAEFSLDDLPNSFAIKYNNGSGYNEFVEDKSMVKESDIQELIKSWLNHKVINYGREWSYYNIKPRVIVEKLIGRDVNDDLPDYKFFCFHGKVKYLYTMINYVDNHDAGECSFFTPEFEKLPYRRSEYKPIEKTIEKPENFDKMIEIAEILSKDFPHVRVDLYNIEGKIIFGELTFYNASGYTVFKPDDFDFILGDEFQLKK